MLRQIRPLSDAHNYYNNWTLIIMSIIFMANSYTCIIMMHVIAALGRISIEMYNKKLHAVNNIQELSFNVVHCVMQHL